MSKRKSKRQRDTFAIANRRLSVSLSPSRSIVDKISQSLRLVEDRRQWHPEGTFAPARSVSSPRHRLTVVDRPVRRQTQKNRARFAGFGKMLSQTKATLAFEAPTRLAVCIRRSQRREVLHALRKTGKGSSRKPRRRSWMSEISCRRKK